VTITVSNTFDASVNLSEITGTVSFDGNVIASGPIPSVGQMQVNVTKKGTYTLSVTRNGQTISGTATVNSNCTVTGTLTVQLMGVRIDGCLGQLPGVEVNVSGQAVVSGTTDSNGKFWWLYNDVGTYHLTATHPSGRFADYAADIVSTTSVRRYATTHQLAAADGYSCATRVCLGPNSTSTPEGCNFPYPNTLSATILGHSCTLTGTGGDYSGSFTMTPLTLTTTTATGPDPCQFNTMVCSPECNSPPAGDPIKCRSEATPDCLVVAVRFPTMNAVTCVVRFNMQCFTNGFSVPIGFAWSLGVGVYGCCYDGGSDPSSTTNGELLASLGATGDMVGSPCYPLEFTADTLTTSSKVAGCYGSSGATITE
jgi:hypothetical protein